MENGNTPQYQAQILPTGKVYICRWDTSSPFNHAPDVTSQVPYPRPVFHPFSVSCLVPEINRLGDSWSSEASFIVTRASPSDVISEKISSHIRLPYQGPDSDSTSPSAERVRLQTPALPQASQLITS